MQLDSKLHFMSEVSPPFGETALTEISPCNSAFWGIIGYNLLCWQNPLHLKDIESLEAQSTEELSWVPIF